MYRWTGDVTGAAGSAADLGITAQDLAAATAAGASQYPALAQYAAYGSTPAAAAARYLYAPAPTGTAAQAAAFLQQHAVYQQRQTQVQQAYVKAQQEHQQRLLQAHQQQQQQQHQNRGLARMRQHDVIEIQDSDDEEEQFKDAGSDPKSPSSPDKQMLSSISSRKSGEDTNNTNKPALGSVIDAENDRKMSSSSSGKKRQHKSGNAPKRDSLDSSVGSRRESSSTRHSETLLSTSESSGKKKRSRPRKDSYDAPAKVVAPGNSAAAMEHAKKKMKTVAKGASKPLVVVQNWSRDGLMEELSKKEIERYKVIMDSILMHATGYSTDHPPPGTGKGKFQPPNITLSMNQRYELTKALVKSQSTALQEAVDAAFYKCALHVEDMRNGNDQLVLPTTTTTTTTIGQPTAAAVSTMQQVAGGGTPGSVFATPPMMQGLTGGLPTGAGAVGLMPLSAPTGAADPVPNRVSGKTDGGLSKPDKVSNEIAQKAFEAQQHVVKYQHDELIRIKQRLAEVMEEKKQMLDAFKKEQAYLKDQVARSKTIHARSVHAFMKASVTSLRWLRERANVDEEDEEEGGEFEDDVEKVQ